MDSTTSLPRTSSSSTIESAPESQPSSSWWDLSLQNFVDTAEQAASDTASFFREGAQETIQETINVIAASDFYRKNLVYNPEDEAPHQQQSTIPDNTPPRAITTTPSTDNDDEDDEHNPTDNEEEQPYADPLSDLTLPITDRINLAGQSIGYVRIDIGPTRNVSIDGTFDSDHTRPYICISLGSAQRFVSAVGKPTSNTGEFIFPDIPTKDGLLLVAQDIGADLVIELWNKNILLADTLLGKVVLPMANVVPSINQAMRHQRYEPYVVDRWFEFYALKKRKFAPASKDIAGTGIDRAPPPGLGYIKLRCELHLHGRISMWAGYAMPPMQEFSPVPVRPQPTGDLKFISEINQTGRGFKRNFSRVKKALAKLASRGDHAWVPFRFANRARHLHDPASTCFLLVFAVHVCLYSEMWALPLNFFLVVMVSTLALRGTQRHNELLVWNDDIRDPDDLLGPMQKVAKMIYLLEKFERWMGVAADTMERAINILNFADERVTFAALLFLGGACALTSSILYLFSPGYISFGIFCIWFIGDKIDQVMMIRTPTQPGVVVETASQDLSSGSRLVQARAVMNLMLKTPWLVGNIFARVPTDDELGHRTISRWQMHPTEPEFVEVKRDANIVTGTMVDSDTMWLREM